MGEIHVTFWGICTGMGIHQEHGPSPAGRMVLVDASHHSTIEGNPHLAGKHIDPHFARLHIRADDIKGIGALPVFESPIDQWLRFDLRQVTVAIGNPEPGMLQTEYSCIPQLSKWAGPEIGQPNEAAVRGGPAMACIFPLTSGTIRGVATDGGAAVSVLTSGTNGDPALSITPFGGTAVTTIVLRSGASILLTNLPHGLDGLDHENDFLLHYLTLETFPATVGHPSSTTCHPSPVDDGGLGLFVGPPCSNSNYP